MEQFDEIYVVGPGSDYGNAMWSDFGKIANGEEYLYAISTNNRFLKLLHHIHFSFALNKKRDLPFQKIWKRFYSIENIRFQDSKNYFILLPDVSACRIDKSYLEQLHNRKNVCLVLFVVNIMQRKTRLITDRIKCFDYVYSFSEVDAQKYGFIFHNSVYSRQIVNMNQSINYDAFFAGSYSEKRLKDLRVLSQRMIDSGLVPQFHVNNVKKQNILDDSIIYNNPLSYNELLNKTLASNCIIEILAEGAECGFTMRTAEALCYNKKLITNNAQIKYSKYYDPQKIQIFSNVEDVDINFVVDRTPIDYKYEDDFSPLEILKNNEIQNWLKNSFKKEV